MDIGLYGTSMEEHIEASNNPNRRVSETSKISISFNANQSPILKVNGGF